MMKKIISIVTLTAVIGMAGIPYISAYTSADEPEETHGERIRRSNADCTESVLYTSEITSRGDTDGMMSVSEVDKGLLEYFQNETEELEDAYIDLSAYNLSVDEFDSIYRMLVFCSPESYYLMDDNGTYYYDMDIDGDKVYGVWPIYTIDVFDDDLELDSEKVAALMPEIEANRQLFEDEYQSVMRVVNYGMSETEKLITFQNYMHFRYTYAYNEYSRALNERTNNTALELIKYKTGMCQAYSVFFNYLMMREGMETAFVTGYDQYGNEFHVWNMVKVASPSTDNKYYWYHIDTTWN
ncbi:MAG: transglutaminase domain-containing protein, partial [Candidatus Ornithomonoglobus sp.]